MVKTEAVRVCVIIPTHSKTRPVGRAVESVFTSTKTKIDVKVVAHNVATELILEQLGDYSKDDRVEVLELNDGIGSPAGPKNYALSTVDHDFVVFLDSDDTLEHRAIDEWVETARLIDGSLADMVIAPIKNNLNGAIRTSPPARLKRVLGPKPVQLNGIKDRLVYRSAPLGLIGTKKFGGLRFTTGVASGEDQAFSSEIWFRKRAKIVYRLAGPAYIEHFDQNDRVTRTTRHLTEEFAYLDQLLSTERSWHSNENIKANLIVKQIRMNLFDALKNRLAEAVFDSAGLREIAEMLETYSPKARGFLSRIDVQLLDAILAEKPVNDLSRLLRKRRSLKTPAALLPQDITKIFDSNAPLRFHLAGAKIAKLNTSKATRSRAALKGLALKNLETSRLNLFIAKLKFLAEPKFRVKGNKKSDTNKLAENLTELKKSLDKPGVLIGPANYAGQGFYWARSIEKLGFSVRNIFMNPPTKHSFEADIKVPQASFLYDRKWRKSFYELATQFQYVLVEANLPLSGGHKTRLKKDLQFFVKNRMSVAFMAHGTEIRKPSMHASMTPWSPYTKVDGNYLYREKDTQKTIDFLNSQNTPKFVSTPDLTFFIEDAVWAPVVVPGELITKVSQRPERNRPVVTHIPSRSAVKGSDLIHEQLLRLDAAGIIEYIFETNIPWKRVIELYSQADIVLDQFLLGSYGVAACEAMAVGAVVVGHVTQDVRDVVTKETGLELPIVEATVDTLESVLKELSDDRARRLDLGEASKSYVEQVHDGTMSARVFSENWLKK